MEEVNDEGKWVCGTTSCVEQNRAWPLATPMCAFCGRVRVSGKVRCVRPGCNADVERGMDYCPVCFFAQDAESIPHEILVKISELDMDLNRVRVTVNMYSGKTIILGHSAKLHDALSTSWLLVCVAYCLKHFTNTKLFQRAADMLIGKLKLGDVWGREGCQAKRQKSATHLAAVWHSYLGDVAEVFFFFF